VRFNVMPWLAFDIEGVQLNLPREPGSGILRRPLVDRLHRIDEAIVIGEGGDTVPAGTLFAHETTVGREDDAESRLRSFLDLVRVSLLTPVSRDAIMWFDSWGREFDGEYDELSERKGSWLPEGTIDENDLVLLRRHWPEWVDHAPSMEGACLNLERAIFAQIPAETVAWTVAALESMLASDETEGAGYRMRLRTALAATDDQSKRRWWFEVLKQAYDVRSRVMHGASSEDVRKSMARLSKRWSDDEEQAATEILRLGSRICLGVVRRLSRGQSVIQFVADLDHALLSTEIQEATNIIEFPTTIDRTDA
jgi:hypothetical protein